MQEIEDIHFCKVCTEPTRSYCISCSNAFYCCKDHQKRDWKVHKKECFPVKVVKGKQSKASRKLVATKDLKQGQTILEEFPIFVTPNTRTENGITCLGCCKKLGNGTPLVSCIRCGWPLCSVNCDMENLHTNNECMIFQDEKVEPPLPLLGNTYQNLCEIGVLRMLLLKTRNPSVWEKLMEQDSFKEARKVTPDNMFSMKGIIRFIQQDCKMKHFDEGIIDTAFGILRGNSFDTSDHCGFIECCLENVRSASVIFSKAIIPGSNCVPNASYTIHGRQNGNFRIVCIATVDIAKGEEISIPYEDDMSGTFFRRKVKETVFFQNCVCSLCADPTEMGTLISAIKCNACKSGNFLASNPLNAESEWNCDKCSCIITHFKMLEILQSAKKLLQDSVNLSTYSHESLESIEKVGQSILHPNHFLILQAKMEICRRILQVIGVFELKNITSVNISTMLDNLVSITRHVLSVADVLRPGFTRSRGRLLYCLQFGMLVSLLNEEGIQSNKTMVATDEARFLVNKRKKLELLSQIQKEAEMILELETDESAEEHKMLKTLRGELKMALKTIH